MLKFVEEGVVMPVVSVSIPEDKLEQVFAVAFAPVVALSELIKNASDSCHIKKDTIKVFIEEDEQRIRIVDNGYGFSANDISQLGVVTTSSKMSSRSC
ncbi:ATP-binding protein [Terasakiella sp. A23]|uniref:ATP-binding protein n=1 Tax=Terasakiella sp. FCG-A23 TaxID=3080561 RepID=UPI0029538A49|nr:ATP-binding protein [Terasakiella sp. A23]MDV7339094.1 ATP-binding protein [Terasakiella sp. A23]